MQDSEYIAGLLEFLKNSPTPFHAVEQMVQQLEQAGFKRLREADAWQLDAAGKYFVTRNDSSIIAFTLAGNPVDSGFRMAGAHTDSPCLKVKPKPELAQSGYYQLAVEVYGGALLNPWFDRDLSLAGRVSYLDNTGEVRNALIDFEQPIATIPSLAIHLDREANEIHAINKQLHLPPVILKLPDEPEGTTGTEVVTPQFRDLLLKLLRKQHADAQRVLDYELSFYDTQPPAVIGLHQDFIASARLDNLLSCYTGLVSLLRSGEGHNALLVCNDHEEVGSMSAAGAQGPFLQSVLQRITGTGEALARVVDRSIMVSADNAHGIHPNFADKHDANHGPLLNQGSGDQAQPQPALCHQRRNQRDFQKSVREGRCTGAVIRGAQRYGLRQYHRPDHRQCDRCTHAGYRRADLRHALDPRAGRALGRVLSLPGTA